jgi:lipopolysaccharide/colanic/teichoic acid biosynthesis glycosyltransferase
MSFVGPRPIVAAERERYGDAFAHCFSVPPGLTGLWQVSGRSDLSFDEMVLLDIYYVENWSLAIDLRMALRTVPQFFFGDGAY